MTKKRSRLMIYKKGKTIMMPRRTAREKKKRKQQNYPKRRS